MLAQIDVRLDLKCLRVDVVIIIIIISSTYFPIHTLILFILFVEMYKIYWIYRSIYLYNNTTRTIRRKGKGYGGTGYKIKIKAQPLRLYTIIK